MEDIGCKSLHVTHVLTLEIIHAKYCKNLSNSGHEGPCRDDRMNQIYPAKFILVAIINMHSQRPYWIYNLTIHQAMNGFMSSGNKAIDQHLTQSVSEWLNVAPGLWCHICKTDLRARRSQKNLLARIPKLCIFSICLYGNATYGYVALPAWMSPTGHSSQQ